MHLNSAFSKFLHFSSSNQIFEETSRYQQQSMAFRLLQQRLMEKERSYEKLHGKLIERFGQDEVAKLATMVEHDK